MVLVDKKLFVDFKQGCAIRDRQLVTEAQAGSSESFAQLECLYRRKLYNTVVAITGNREDAEDALQDTFLRAYLALHRFEGRSSVYSWLTRIAINSALMILRRRRAHPEVYFDSHSEERDGNHPLEVKDAALNPEQMWAHQQRWTNMLYAIERLDPKLRAPIQVLLARECSMNEIAQTLDITVAAVKARLHRARRRLTSTRLMRRPERTAVSRPA
jgi:RNA polymerase sigma-70 factor (ECF subfamily)